MNRPLNWSDLWALEAAEKKAKAIRELLEPLLGLDEGGEEEGVRGALGVLDPLEDAIGDVAAEVEMELRERSGQGGR